MSYRQIIGVDKFAGSDWDRMEEQEKERRSSGRLIGPDQTDLWRSDQRNLQASHFAKRKRKRNKGRYSEARTQFQKDEMIVLDECLHEIGIKASRPKGRR